MQAQIKRICIIYLFSSIYVCWVITPTVAPSAPAAHSSLSRTASQSQAYHNGLKVNVGDI